MKNITLLFALILCWNAEAQQFLNLEDNELENRFLDTSLVPVINGKILHYSAIADKDLVIEYHLVNLEQKQKKRQATIQEDGTFELQLDLPLPYQQIWLSIGEYYWGQITANEELLIEVDLKRLKKKQPSYHDKGIQFKGKDGALNRYSNKFVEYKLGEKRKFSDKLYTIILDRQSDISDKVQQYQEAYEIWDNILASYIEKNPSPYSFLLQNERDSEYYGWLYTFYWGHGIDEDALNTAFQHRVKEVLQTEVKDENLIVKLDTFLHQYQLKLDKADSFNSNVFNEHNAFFYDQYRSELQMARWKSFAQKTERFNASRGDILKLVGNPEDKWHQVTYYQMMLPTMKTKWVKSIMQTQLDESLEYVASVDRTLAEASTLTESSSLGKSLKSFPFGGKLYEAEAMDAKKLLASIQNAFPNKTLILDVWATWCGPCLDDMKNSKDSKAALEELAVEVIYLCVEEGSSKKKWEKTVAGLKTEGTHIFLEKNLAQSVMDFFDLNSYPSHVFIDKEGNWDTNFIYSIADLDIEQLKIRLLK